MEHTDRNLSTPIASAEALDAEYAFWLKVSKPEFLEPVLKFVSTLNIDALRTSASQTMKSECTNTYHISTGGFNAVYLLTFLDGREAIARINQEVQTTDQTLLRDRLLSEAATLRYVRTHCAIPVPQVHAVYDSLPNPVGARYMIEDRILGRHLLWLRYTSAQRREIATQIFKCEAELIRARFSSIGSIYYRPENDTFYVGPMGPAICRPLNHTVDRGPWKSTSDWLKAYVKSELAGLRKDPDGYHMRRKNRLLDDGNPPFAYHVAWLETLLITIDQLRYLKSLPACVERPVLRHEDLSDGNILVYYDRPTTLAGIIDFEGARVVPLWSAMVTPDFCDDVDPAEHQSLMEIRDQILCEADPACAEAKVHRASLRLLLWLVYMGVTSWCSIEQQHNVYHQMKEAWPEDEPAFMELDKLVALGPTGYAERGRD